MDIIQSVSLVVPSYGKEVDMWVGSEPVIWVQCQETRGMVHMRSSSGQVGPERLVNYTQLLHRKKKVREFLVPSRDVTTKLSLGGNNDVITELLLPRGSLVSDIPAGDGKLVNLFLQCTLPFISFPLTDSRPSVTQYDFLGSCFSL
jgi:hypothetical protein